MNQAVLTIVLMLIATFIGAIGSLFLKLGSSTVKVRFTKEGIMNIVKNWRLILGFAIYGFSTVLFIMVLRITDLSIAYPMTSLTYVFITILSAFILKEHITKYKIVGIGFIILGVVLIKI